MKIKGRDYAIIQAINVLGIVNKMITNIPDGVPGKLRRIEIAEEVWEMFMKLKKDVNVEYDD